MKNPFSASLTLSLLLSLSTVAGCGTTESAGTDAGGLAQADAEQQPDGGGTDAAGRTDDGATTDAGAAADASGSVDAAPLAPNAKTNGEWELMAPAQTCGISFGVGFTGTSVTASDYNFKLTMSGIGAVTMSCSIKVADHSQFTCANVTQSGLLAPGCPGSVEITSIDGVIIGDAVEISATVKRSAAGGCGPALNCGPLPHTATGKIVP